MMPKRFDMPYDITKCSLPELRKHYETLMKAEKELEAERESYGVWADNSRTKELDRERQRVGSITQFVFNEINRRTIPDYDV